MIRLLIVDDHQVTRWGLRALFEGRHDVCIVAEADCGTAALARYTEHRPDVVLMDWRMPGLSGAETTAAMRRLDPDARVLIFSSYDESWDIERARAAGACGHASKELAPAAIVQAVRTVAAGEACWPDSAPEANAVKLPCREVTILSWLTRGLSNGQIADKTGLSPGTVRIYVSKLFARLGVKNRAEAARWAIERGVVKG